MKVNKKYRFYKSYIQNAIFCFIIMGIFIFLSFLSKVYMICFIPCSFICLVFLCVYIDRIAEAHRITKNPRSEGIVEHIEITGYKYTFHIKYMEEDKEKHIISIPFVLNRITFDISIGKVQKECLNKKVTFVVEDEQAYMMDIME